MTWTAPKTFTANSAPSAADLNAYLRDNSLETAPAKATTAGSYFSVAAINSIAERIPASAVVDTVQTTTSTTYVDLATVGPTVTVDTSDRALVFISSSMENTSNGGVTRCVFAVSGATTIAASDTFGIMSEGTVNHGERFGTAILIDGLNTGSNTFTAKYKAESGTGSFGVRHIAVLPF